MSSTPEGAERLIIHKKTPDSNAGHTLPHKGNQGTMGEDAERLTDISRLTAKFEDADKGNFASIGQFALNFLKTGEGNHVTNTLRCGWNINHIFPLFAF